VEDRRLVTVSTCNTVVDDDKEEELGAIHEDEEEVILPTR
jgi:hypothetical protein